MVLYLIHGCIHGCILYMENDAAWKYDFLPTHAEVCSSTM